MNKKLNVLDLCYIAACSALMAVCAWINIPVTPPFTLQILAMVFALAFLGGKKGTISILIYILLGAVGVPVFAGFKGGFSVLIGMTGGYIVGFIFMGLVYILFEVIFKDKYKIWLKIVALLIGLVLCYAFGTIWFVNVYTKAKGAISFITALSLCVFPFVLFDLLKMGLGFSLALTIKKALKINNN